MTTLASRSASRRTQPRTAIGRRLRGQVAPGAALGHAVVGTLADEPAAEPGVSIAAHER
jgi:hypothetical protein